MENVCAHQARPTGNGTCTITQSDSNNCGACGNQCPVGQVCTSGQCAEPTIAVTTVSTTPAGSSVPSRLFPPLLRPIQYQPLPPSPRHPFIWLAVYCGGDYRDRIYQVNQVNFGTIPATTYTVNSATQITATAPAGQAGVFFVTVTTPGGTSAISGGSKFTYTETPQTATAPTVTGLSSSSGAPSGIGVGALWITGNGFTGATNHTLVPRRHLGFKFIQMGY